MPRVRSDRISQGKDTVCTGFIECRSFFAMPEYVADQAKKKVIELMADFKDDEIILTGFNRC